jgi:4-amino-4-deoxy-L-arabinose transferase-like glycosyltransferase
VECLIRSALKRLDSDRATYAIVGFGLILRIIALVMVGGRPLDTENPGYDQMALQLLRHENFSPYFPPGVPYLLLLSHTLFGDGLLVARATILPVYVGFSFVLVWLVREISTRRAGNLGALAFALYPTYVRWSFSPTTEYPAAACLVAVVYLEVLTERRRSYALGAALGFFLGALVLIRASSLPLIILAPLYLFLKARRLRLALTPLLVSLILISAWVWKAYAMTGRLIMINDSNWQNFFFTNNPDTPLYNTCPGGEVEWEPSKVPAMLHDIETKPDDVQQRLYRDIALHHIASRPDLFLLRTVNRFRTYFGFPIHRGEPLVKYFHLSRGRGLIGVVITTLDLCFYWPIMVLAIVFLGNFTKPFISTDYLVVILGAAVAYALPYWLSCSQPRYNFPVLPLFAVFAAMLADALLERSRADVLQPLLHSTYRRRATLLALALFAYIQIEWIVFVVNSRW